ncbi:MAG: glycosyl transferase family 1 [Flavobacteriaceae bacterium]|mgnify:CR=1 FL=1|nr:glycosyl transferase family 1 [Flavobacteriaceae bacterium]
MNRVLIITYYWPPAGGPGVQRWLHFVRYFKEFGIEPVVYIPQNAHYPLVDASFSKLVPEDIEILSHPVREPHKWAQLLFKKKTKRLSSGIITKKKPSPLEKAMLFIRGNFFIPDARISWVVPSVSYLSDYLTNNPVQAIITTGPPHSLHLVGLQLRKQFRTPWLADFRDPWTTIHYHSQLYLLKRAARKHKRLEREVLDGADAITVTSPTTKNEFSNITNTSIHVVTNGFEPSTIPNQELDTRFTLVHIGSLLSERNPSVLWKTLAKLIAEHPEFRRSFQLKLAGVVSDDIISEIKSAGLDDHLVLEGYVPHSEAIRRQHAAQMLLLVEMDRPETRAIIPGKLFEYLAAGRPVIALGPSGSDVENILRETNSGNFFHYNDAERLEQVLLRNFELYRQGELLVEEVSLTKYSRRALTEKMAAILKSLAST